MYYVYLNYIVLIKELFQVVLFQKYSLVYNDIVHNQEYIPVVYNS